MWLRVLQRRRDNEGHRQRPEPPCLLQVARAVPRLEVVVGEKTREMRDLPLLFFEQDGVLTFAIGLGCGPIPVFGVVGSGIRPFCICHNLSKTFEGIQETTLMGEERCLEDALGMCVFSHLMSVALE